MVRSVSGSIMPPTLTGSYMGVRPVPPYRAEAFTTPLSKSILADDDLQCSALGNSATSWGAKALKPASRLTVTFPFAGAVHMGRSGLHRRANTLSHQEFLPGACGYGRLPERLLLPAPGSWTECRKAPMVHLFPYWDFSPGQMTDVRVCSNAPAVELFFNDVSLGIRALEGNYIADWQIPCQPAHCTPLLMMKTAGSLPKPAGSPLAMRRVSGSAAKPLES